ncbi:hypothetical protein Barb7_01461 [Bacteroidales bacterium Barb7]|nr:hypothetical protein Barb7_01461 [Bacteroidales bacterium Barb7]
MSTFSCITRFTSRQQISPFHYFVFINTLGKKMFNFHVFTFFIQTNFGITAFTKCHSLDSLPQPVNIPRAFVCSILKRLCPFYHKFICELFRFGG